MPDYDGGFKIAARHSGVGLSRLAGVAVEEWTPIPDTVQATERLAGRAFRAKRGGERFVVYMEAYTRWAESAPWSVLAKSGLLSERERLPCECLVFVLLPRGYRPQEGTFQLSIEGRPAQQVWFREVLMWRQRPEDWWEHHPGLMALYPLSAHGTTAAEAVAHAVESIRHRSLDSARRADLLTSLGFFGRLVDDTLDVWSLIGRENMRDSSLARDFMLEGEQAARRSDVLEVIELRFGEDAVNEFRDALARITDVERLRGLHRAAIQARRVSQVRRAVAEVQGEGA